MNQFAKKHSEAFSHESFTYHITLIDEILEIKCTGNMTTEINYILINFMKYIIELSWITNICF